uniref:Uncharacterized protein n=1 Tax=Anguilla anguilla TaxID=7936 RepID=A0A0E9VQ21_ANGAN
MYDMLPPVFLIYVLASQSAR